MSVDTKALRKRMPPLWKLVCAPSGVYNSGAVLTFPKVLIDFKKIFFPLCILNQF